MTFPAAFEKRFWERVRTDDPDACWIWPGWKSGNGYGRVQINGKAYVASRVALELSGVDIPDGQFCCHRCDNRPCCNPSHLFIGSVAENNQDRHEKGRSDVRKGERNPRAKLDEQTVREIRLSSETNISLSRRYGVHHTTISDIRRGKNWAVRQDAPSPTSSPKRVDQMATEISDAGEVQAVYDLIIIICEHDVLWKAKGAEALRTINKIAKDRSRLTADNKALRSALKRISTLRPAGDVATATNTRTLVQMMESIALAALSEKGKGL